MTTYANVCGTTTYTWDVKNRLIGISGFKPDCTSLTASFTYDALGRRIQKTINGRTIQYLYDGKDIVQDIENGLPSVNDIRTLNIDEPLARIDLATNTVRYYHADALGSIIGLSDENGQMVTKYAYDAFGHVTMSGEMSDNPFQYTGRENDGTGLYYYRARYYSSALQRFVSEDPIRFRGGDVNFFVYVKNRPLIRTDFDGLGGCGPFGTHLADPFGFEECCNAHDGCYNRCDPKANCDGDFCACLKRKCKEGDKRFSTTCTTELVTYCGAVCGFGTPSYIVGCGEHIIDVILK